MLKLYCIPHWNPGVLYEVPVVKIGENLYQTQLENEFFGEVGRNYTEDSQIRLSKSEVISRAIKEAITRIDRTLDLVARLKKL